jgi:hypothetical protein
MSDSKIFDLKYVEYLARVKDINMDEKLDILGIQKRNDSYIFNFFNRRICFDGSEFTDISGAQVTPAIKVVLCQYLLMCPEKAPENSNRLITFREFENSGPLFSSFTSNTGKIIETTFSGKMGSLKARSLSLGGTLVQTNGYDLSFRFRALSKVPIILNFNDIEESMPASAGFLYHENAKAYLDLECLTVLCTFLTGQLIKTN